jgi:Transposase DDE domain
MSHPITLFHQATPLRDLTRLAIAICRRAEPLLPLRGPGRPVEFAPWAVAVMVLVAVAKRLTTKSSQYRYLRAHADALTARLGLDRFPARSTYFARYRTAYVLLAEAIRDHAAHAAGRGHIDIRCAAADKTLIAASGPAWHKAQRLRGERPKGADGDASWSRSAHDGWVYGYGVEVVVTAPRRGLVWPLAGSLDSAHLREAKTFAAKAARLSARTRYVLVDMGYDSNDLGEAVERDDAGRETGRRLVGPQQSRHNRYGGRKQVWRETHRRRSLRAHRAERRRFYEGRLGRSLYKRRGKTVEPFFGRLKGLFGLTEHVWHSGLGNNRTQVMAALVLYQILLAYNRIKGHDNAEVKWILDLL